MSVVLGIDLGTQSIKAVFYDASSRRIVAQGAQPLALRQDEHGKAEQEAEWWLLALREALSGVDRQIRESAQAIGVSGQQHGFVALRDDRVLAPVKLWCDTTTDVECTEITERFGGRERCIKEVGNAIPPGFTASKIAWLRKHRPEDYAQLNGILLPHDYLNLYLTGEKVTEAGDASGTGFLDIRTRTWSARMLAAIDPQRDLSACLPSLRSSNEAIGELRPSIADELGLRSGIPVSIGGGDNMMAAIGTGNTRRGRLTVSLGTSGTVFGFSERPVIDDNGEIAAFCSSNGGWLPLLCTMNCTSSTELLRTLFAAGHDDFETALAASKAGANGAITVPFFNGERTPNLPNAKACLFGLDATNTDRVNLLRATVEGVTFALRTGVERLVELGLEAQTLTLTGGGSNSPGWRRIVANVIGRPVVITAQSENAAFGAALQALEVISPDALNSVDDLVDDHVVIDEAKGCEPDAALVDEYQTYYDRYKASVACVAAMYP